MKKLFLFLALFSSSLIAAEVVCTTIQEDIKKIRCKYSALAQETPRQVTYTWTSPENSADNRTKVHNIPAGHVSVYDYRYFGGRAEGKWKIEVSEEDNSTVATDFLKDSNAEVGRDGIQDPLLKEAATK